MKTKNLFFSKKTFFACIAIAMISMSCNKAIEAVQEADTISEDEAAEVMIQSMSEQSGGLVVQTETVAEVVTSMDYVCGQLADTIYGAASVPGAAISYDYLLHIERTLFCEMGFPKRLDVNFDGRTTYSAPRMSSDDKTTAAFVVSGFDFASDHLTVTQQYERDGTQQSKVRLQRSFTSKLTATSTNITIDKSNLQISGGTVGLEFTGSTSGGKTVSYSATVTLNGNKEGVIVFKNGASYTFKWK